MNPQPWLIDLASFYLFGVEMALFLVATLIALSSIDDLLIDLIYWSRRLYRRWFVYRRHRRISVEHLRPQPPQWAAILVPAWQEAEVIGAMLRHLLDHLDYRPYRIFVGSYPNDPATGREIRQLLAGEPRLVHVVTPEPGPTSKGDCLNRLYAATLDYERAHHLRFGFYVLHDAEDVVHALELTLFNHLIPDKDMVQVPVQPLPRRWRDMVGGHYLDEFSESHCKDLIVREALTGGVPSAGVGCAFSRRAMRLAAQGNGGAPFNPRSVTEDYEIALRLGFLGLRSAFVRIPDHHAHPVAVREYFPAQLDAAVRQKARWLLGIALQGWRDLRWQGGPGQRYMLARDRKALLTAPLGIAAYLIAAQIVAFEAAAMLWPRLPHFAPLIEAGSTLGQLVALNALFLANRLAQRAACVWRVYGPYQALLSLPRQIVANIVNFLACRRAIELYRAARRHDGTVAWDKTRHDFPYSPMGG